jgi:hypothetical protein
MTFVRSCHSTKGCGSSCATLRGFLVVLALVNSGTAVAAADAETAPELLPDHPLALIEPRGQADLDNMDQRIYVSAEKLARYLRSLVHPWRDDPQLLLLTDSRSGEHHIRPNAGALEGFCLLYRFGPYDEQLVGVPRRQLLAETIVPMMRYLVTTHVTGPRATSDGRRWGDAWQSAHWTQKLGRAAWYAWDDLPTDVRDGVRRVVAHEADRIAGMTPPHQIQRDTKAEENAWNSRIFSAAVLLMPADSRRAGWEAALQKWAMSSFLRPADERSQAVVDGRTVAAQFTGANLYDDFTLENHNIVHPDYMTCFSLTLATEVDYALSGRQPPESLRYNAAGIYENLKWFVLPDGGFVYPNGQDWQLFRNPDWIAKSVMMSVLLGDPEAWSLVCRSAAALEKMQARFTSGAVYAADETQFASSQSDLISSLATSWLILKMANRIHRAPCKRLGIRRLDAGKILLHRTAGAVHTFSWGATVMAQCVPYQLDRIVSPDQLNGIGQITLSGDPRPQRTRPHDVQVDSGEDWFTAHVVIDHGERIRSELKFTSNRDGSFTMREKLVALADVATARIATGQIGILNNAGWIYENGRRRLRLGEREEVVPALSGRTIEATDVQQIAIDDVLEIQGTERLAVAYLAATAPHRCRATDLLYLNYINGERQWRAGETISQYEAVLRVKPLSR